MPAVPVIVVTFTTVSTELMPLRVTVNTAAVPSATVGLLIVTVGSAFVSVMVAVPVALVLLVLPEVTVPLNVKVSLGSLMASVLVGTLTVTLVCPAGIVTVVVVVV